MQKSFYRYQILSGDKTSGERISEKKNAKIIKEFIYKQRKEIIEKQQEHAAVIFYDIQSATINSVKGSILVMSGESGQEPNCSTCFTLNKEQYSKLMTTVKEVIESEIQRERENRELTFKLEDRIKQHSRNKAETNEKS